MRTTKVNTDLGRIILSTLNAEELARQAGLIKNPIQSKISAETFILGFWLMLSDGKNTLSAWVAKIGQLGQHAITPQGLEYKFSQSCVDYCKRLFEDSMSKQISSAMRSNHQLFSSFPKVYLEDSSCIRVHQQLKNDYKGSYSKKNGQGATIKFQVTTELVNSTIEKITVGDFRQNDQSYATDIINRAEKGSLVLRDLGYFVLEAFRQMTEKGIYFLSRAKPNVNVFDALTGKQCNLVKLFDNCIGDTIDMDVQLGVESKVSARLIAVRLPQEVASRRRQKAKEDRSQSANHSEEYYKLLGWTILITNIERDKLDTEALVKIYACRWRIEILFKAWKSAGLNMDKILGQKMKVRRFQVSVYLALLYIVQFCQAVYAAVVECYKSKTGEKQNLSILKVYAWVVQNFQRMNVVQTCENLADLFLMEIKRECSYKKRRDRTNFADLYT